jgi:hypothetical protein
MGSDAAQGLIKEALEQAGIAGAPASPSARRQEFLAWLDKFEQSIDRQLAALAK